MNTLRSTPLQRHQDILWTWIPPALMLLLYVIIRLTGCDRDVFLALNHIGHHAGATWWAHLTILGDGAVTLALVLPAIRRSPHHFWAALIAALIVTAWVQLCKHWMPLPRPLAVMPADAFFHSGPRLRMVSFPSGHAAAIATLTGIWIISFRGRPFLRSLLLTLAILVSVSRIMVGVHWPLDVLAGMLGGWVAAFAGLMISRRVKWSTSGIGGLLAGGILAAIAISLLFSRHTGFSVTLLFQRMLGLACLIAGAIEILRLRVQARAHLSEQPQALRDHTASY